MTRLAIEHIRIKSEEAGQNLDWLQRWAEESRLCCGSCPSAVGRGDELVSDEDQKPGTAHLWSDWICPATGTGSNVHLRDSGSGHLLQRPTGEGMPFGSANRGWGCLVVLKVI